MLLGRLVKQQKIIEELNRKGFYESQDGKPLKSLKLSQLERELVRLPELRELAEHER